MTKPIPESLAEIKKRLSDATPVVAWYVHPLEDGNLRGPYNRWLNIVGPKEELVQNNRVVRADYVKDLEMFANAPTDLAKLIEVVELALNELNEIIEPDSEVFKQIAQILEKKV